MLESTGSCPAWRGDMRAGDGQRGWAVQPELGVKDLQGALQFLLWFASHFVPFAVLRTQVRPVQVVVPSSLPFPPNCRLRSLS